MRTGKEQENQGMQIMQALTITITSLLINYIFHYFYVKQKVILCI